MKKIKSFEVDHRKISEGVYISRVDDDITTYDMRTRKPNTGDLMDNCTMHSAEHMFATYIRNSEIKDKVVYFGPMGCQTGFYLLVRNADNSKVLATIKAVLLEIINHNGEIFGNSEIECGNYKSLSLEAAKLECKTYLNKIEDNTSKDLLYIQ